MKKSILILVLSSFHSQFVNDKNNDSTNYNLEGHYSENYTDTKPCSKTIISNEFCYNIFSLKKDKKIIVNKLFTHSYSIKTGKNLGHGDVGNKSYMLYYGNSNVILRGMRKTKGSAVAEDWISAKIQDNSLNMGNNVKIGMTKNDFLSLLGSEFTSCNIILVTTEEYTYKNTFFFRNNRLQVIELSVTGD